MNVMIYLSYNYLSAQILQENDLMLISRLFFRPRSAWLIVVTVLIMPYSAATQSLNIPSSRGGISFGNSKAFTGLRFNYRDRDVEYVNGINVTLWQPHESKQLSQIRGLSLGVLPGGGELSGIQLGLLGVSAQTNLRGISFGLLGIGGGAVVKGISIGGLGLGGGGIVSGLNIGGLGVGAGGILSGITLAGLGAGSGGDVSGLNLAGLGFGAGGDMRGITMAGFGVGAAENVGGLQLAGFGIGAGGNLTGISMAAFGVGAGGDITGISITGLGVGAGEKIKGITISGLGVGAGNELCGITLAGLGAGSRTLRGLTIAGIAVGGKELKGVQLALGTVRVADDGCMSLFSASAFNHVQGIQSGLSIGLVNYARRLVGLQLGVINIVKDNPKYLRILPLFNAGFK